MPAELKEGILRPHPIQAKDLSECPAQDLLCRRAGTAPRHRADPVIGRRQRPPVHLPVHRQRQRVKHHQCRRHHVIRQLRRHELAYVRDVNRVRDWHYVTDEPFVPRNVLTDRGNRLRHLRMACQRRLDFARLDPEPADLDLVIGTPGELQHPAGGPPGQVTGPVHPAARRPERARHEPLGGQARLAERNPEPGQRRPHTALP